MSINPWSSTPRSLEHFRSRSWNRKVRLSVVSLAALLALATAALFGLQPDPALASAPTITGGPTITSSPASDTTYAAKEKITLTFTFSENVTVTGEPVVFIRVGGKGNERTARYSAGSGGTTLTFSYQVKRSDSDADGISIPKNKLRLPDGATIKDGNSDDAELEHPRLASQVGHKVNGGAGPKITSGPTVTSSPASDSTYAAKEEITLTVTFNENVTVTGKPRLPIEVGTDRRYAKYESGNNGSTLTFSYQVRGKDEDTDGISIKRPIGLGKNSTIKDSDGNAARLQHGGLATQPSHKVDGGK